MERLITLGLAGASLAAIMWMIRQLKRLRTNVYAMEEAPYANQSQPDNTLIGLNLKALFRFPAEFANTPALVVITSPSCSSCHRTLEELIQANHKQPIPFFTINKRDDGRAEDVEKFDLKYQNQLTIVPATAEYVGAVLKIKSTPVLCLVDSQGVVVAAQRPLRQMIGLLLDTLTVIDSREKGALSHG